MAHTYSQLYVQIVFTVDNRLNLIQESFRIELEKYICGIIKGKSCKPLSIYCNPDHVHILINFPPDLNLSALVRDIKCNSSKFINLRRWTRFKFAWQQGYGVFSYSKSQIKIVAKYIENQPNHHKKETFQKEFLDILEKREIAYNENCLFRWLDK